MKTELEQWLRKEAAERSKHAESRKEYARAWGMKATDEEHKASHALAEQMMGRKLPKTSRAEDVKSAEMQERIAAKLEREAAMLLRFADFVSERRGE